MGIVSLLVLPAAGFFVGIIAAIAGVGGGIIIVPLLAVLFRFLPQHAVGTSLASIIFTALASTLSYARQKRIFFRTGLLLAITTVPGAYVGAYLTTVISPRLLGLIFGLFLLLISLRMMLARKQRRAMFAEEAASRALYAPDYLHLPSETTDAELVRTTRVIVPGVGLSFFSGLASGFLGIGGGVLGVPVMNLVMHIPIHFATATSMFTMIFTSAAGVAKHTLAGHVHWGPALLLAVGTMLGARVGADASRRIPGSTLSLIFGVLLAAVSLQMILKYL